MKEGKRALSGGADSRIRAGGGAPELFEARVRPQSVSKVLRTFRIQAVFLEAANKGANEVSGGADTFRVGYKAGMGWLGREWRT